MKAIPKGSLIVSCQARADNPLHGPVFMAAMAQAADQGGAGAIRANGAADIAAIRRVTDLPIIGIAKHLATSASRSTSRRISHRRSGRRRWRGHHRDRCDAALPGRRRPGQPDRAHPARSQAPGLRRHLDRGRRRAAESLGATYVATTLAGYTEETASRREAGPDFGAHRGAGRRRCTGPIIAEGRFDDAELAAEALARGAHAVVVGTVITNPREITRKFVEAAAPERVS